MFLSGELNYDTTLTVVAELEEVERLNPEGFNPFTDLRKVESIPLSSEQIRAVTERRCSAYKGPPVRSAIFASDPLMYGMARIYMAMMEPSPIDVSVFYTLEECAGWVHVDPEIFDVEV